MVFLDTGRDGFSNIFTQENKSRISCNHWNAGFVFKYHIVMNYFLFIASGSLQTCIHGQVDLIKCFTVIII